eukprot:364652-Chlamydomonas_euryale.AAC.4
MVKCDAAAARACHRSCISGRAGVLQLHKHLLVYQSSGWRAFSTGSSAICVQASEHLFGCSSALWPPCRRVLSAPLPLHEPRAVRSSAAPTTHTHTFGRKVLKPRISSRCPLNSCFTRLMTPAVSILCKQGNVADNPTGLSCWQQTGGRRAGKGVEKE